MKKAEVKVGETYAVKVSGQIAPVVIDQEHSNGGWTGTNQHTNRQVRIKSAQRLRGPWDDYLARGDDALGEDKPDATGRDTGTQGEEKPERKPRDAKAEKRATRANGGAQGEAGKPAMSGLDAAAKVLDEAGEPLNCRAIVERAFAAGYWRSDGKTPSATIYSAILRETQKKGAAARFRKVARGKFALSK